MNSKSSDRIATLMQEIYQIDPSLAAHESDLTNLISTLEAHRPQITVDPVFVKELRASLLSYKPAPAIADKTPKTKQLLWWITHLTPVGISLVLFLVLIPDLIKSPSDTSLHKVPDSGNRENVPQILEDMTSESRMDTFMLEGTSESDTNDISILSMPAPTPSLQVAPPTAGNSITITSLTIPSSGWIAIYEDNGGEFGELLARSFVVAGEYNDLMLLLDSQIDYPRLVTVVVYTGNNSEQFDETSETILIDPTTESPMMVTVPVIHQSELEVRN